MRFIVYGVGAIGGVVASALALARSEVVGIARGSQLEAIRAQGLLLRTPERVATARFPCVADPAEIDWRDDDVILLTMKSQDTWAALERLRAVGVREQALFCMQNGVANERMALRFFASVYGVTVMMPADYVVPGEVNVFSLPRHGILDIGRCPQGTDDLAEAVCTALEAANIAAFPAPDVMAGKYGKLLLNLGNIVEAALGPGVDPKPYQARLRAEAEAAYKAAGIAAARVGADARRGELMQMHDISGVIRTGGSSTQSLKRAAGSIETDFLNGEIVLLGRLHGVPTPANAWFCELAHRLVAEHRAPGSVTPAELERALAAA